MTPRRLHWLLQCRGPALDSWPAAERAAALELLRGSDEARNALAEAWAAEAAPEQDSTVQDRIAGTVHRAVAVPAPLLRGMRIGALVACVAAGLFLGLRPQEVETAPPLALTVQLTGPATVLASLDP